jgi:ferritin-like metal-binding protein YciE
MRNRPESSAQEGSETMKEGFEGEVMDAAIIGAAQRVQHYEIAGYGTVREFAEILGENEHVSLLEQTLEEEKQTDQKLTELAQDINPQAEREQGTEEQESATTRSRKNRHSSGSRRAA